MFTDAMIGVHPSSSVLIRVNEQVTKNPSASSRQGFLKLLVEVEVVMSCNAAIAHPSSDIAASRPSAALAAQHQGKASEAE